MRDEGRKDSTTVKRVAIVGAREILQPINSVSNIIPIIEQHHENWDGTGYPNQKKGNEIPVIFISNREDLVFDAIKHKPLCYIRKKSILDDLDSYMEYTWDGEESGLKTVSN